MKTLKQLMDELSEEEKVKFEKLLQSTEERQKRLEGNKESLKQAVAKLREEALRLSASMLELRERVQKARDYLLVLQKAKPLENSSVEKKSKILN